MTYVLEELRRTPGRAPWIFGGGIALLTIALLTGYGLWLLAAAIVIPSAVAILLRPQVGVIIFSALLPFDGLVRSLGPGWAAPWKQIIILGLLVATFVCPTSARAARKRRYPQWVFVFAALLGLGLISAVFQDRNTALVGLRLSYFSAILGYVVWRCPLSRRERDWIVTVFMAMGAVTAVVGLWQQTVGHEYLHSLGYAYDDNIRFTTGLTLRSFSTFDLPFAFGFYLMLTILIGLPVALAEPGRLRNRLFFLSLPLLSVALLFSFVRGAMLGLAVGLLYLAFHRYKILVYGIPLVLLAAIFIPSGTNVTSAVFSSSSFQDRTLSWGDRVDRFAENPFGTGIGTTGAAAEKAAKLNFTDPDATYVPDNSWLKVMFELGVFGVWIFVVMLVSILIATRAAERRSHGIDRDFINGVTAQLLAIMTAAIVATYFELSPMDPLFWLMISIVATMAPEIAPGAPVAGEAARALGHAETT